MAKGYPSPSAALAAIVECLDGMCERVHVGSLGSGLTLPCCPGCLLRVETAGVRVADGQPRSLVNLVKCQTLILDVVITYTQCFKTMTDRGKSLSLEMMTVAGTGLFVSWWDTLAKLACCAPLNQHARFAGITDTQPEGNCAGWAMNLEVDVAMCDPCST